MRLSVEWPRSWGRSSDRCDTTVTRVSARQHHCVTNTKTRRRVAAIATQRSHASLGPAAPMRHKHQDTPARRCPCNTTVTRVSGPSSTIASQTPRHASASLPLRHNGHPPLNHCDTNGQNHSASEWRADLIQDSRDIPGPLGVRPTRPRADSPTSGWVAPQQGPLSPKAPAADQPTQSPPRRSTRTPRPGATILETERPPT
jgi:hypothetical protein